MAMTKKKFPSPHGDYFFELADENEALNMALMVSVPSRGLFF